MIPLETNRRVLLWMCVYQSDEKITWQNRCAHCSFTAFILFGNFISILFSLAFIIENIATNFEESLFAVLQIFAPASVLYITIIILILREEITDIFKTISMIHETCEWEWENEKKVEKLEIFRLKFPFSDAEMDKMHFLLRTHNISEWMWLKYFKLILASAAGVVSVVTIITLLFDWPSNGDFIAIYHTFRVM